ncbi:MAG: hypothetical protein HY515_02455 [Candidatus Aenigmarchaeota archaeon]|nr:hypothetical protein [Candidatus Aenigmarchaeota archaeon]
MKVPALTKEQVSRAERREGIYHPVLDVLDRRALEIAGFNAEYKKLKGSENQQLFVATHLGFLADDMEALPDFTLAPLELIAIWSKACEMMGYYPRKRGLANIVPAAYATKGVQNPGWKRFTGSMLQRCELPEDVEEDKEGLLYVQARVEGIKTGLGEIEFYVSGVRDGAQTIRSLGKKAYQEGDKEAERELDRIEAYQKDHLTPVLSELLENVRTGRDLMLTKLTRALKNLA